MNMNPDQNNMIIAQGHLGKRAIIAIMHTDHEGATFLNKSRLQPSDVTHDAMNVWCHFNSVTPFSFISWGICLRALAHVTLQSSLTLCVRERESSCAVSTEKGGLIKYKLTHFYIII